MQRLLLIAMLSLTSLSTFSQIEGARLTTKDHKAFGFGGFLNASFPILTSSSITAEAGAYIFKKSGEGTVLVPFLLGYRHSFNEDRTGPYIEPTVGYTIGATDLIKEDENGQPVSVSGDYVEREAKGPTAGMCVGYIIPGGLGLNIALRYQHIFVSDDPSFNMYSLRLSFPLRIGKRE